VSLPDDLSGLRAGATGQPLYSDTAEQLAELRREREQRGWDETTLDAHDAALAYREVMADRRERERAERRYL
jgi:hypothetical protein